jgi:hypothetical protein
MNTLQRAMLESELRSKGAMRHSFGMMAETQPREHFDQVGMFGDIRPAEVERPPCDHIGTTREQQNTLFSGPVLVCGRCGATVCDCAPRLHCSGLQRHPACVTCNHCLSQTPATCNREVNS